MGILAVIRFSCVRKSFHKERRCVRICHYLVNVEWISSSCIAKELYIRAWKVIQSRNAVIGKVHLKLSLGINQVLCVSLVQLNWNGNFLSYAYKFPFWPQKVGSVAVPSLSPVRLFATPWTAACQASLSLTTSQSLPTFMSVESVTPFKCVLNYICFSLFSFPLSLLPWLRMLLIFTGFLTGLLTSFSTNSLAPSNHLL